MSDHFQLDQPIMKGEIAEQDTETSLKKLNPNKL